MNPETVFKRLVRSQFEWCAAVEPGRGGDTGFADLVPLVGPQKRLVPLEVKLGTERPDGCVDFHNPGIRPAQVSWHFDLAQAGGFSLLVAGEKRGKSYHCHFFNGADLRSWREGMVPIGDCDLSDVAAKVEELVRIWVD